MEALAAIDRLLIEHCIDGGPVLWLHDEILLEVLEVDAEKSRIVAGEGDGRCLRHDVPRRAVERARQDGGRAQLGRGEILILT